jgi:hypothetical protein
VHSLTPWRIGISAERTGLSGVADLAVRLAVRARNAPELCAVTGETPVLEQVVLDYSEMVCSSLLWARSTRSTE